MKKLLIYASLIFFTIGLAWCGNTTYFNLKAKKADGVVVEIQEHSRTKKGRKKTSFRPVIEFKSSDGAAHRFVSKVGTNPSAYDPGDAVIVLYNPENPSEALVDGLLSKYLGSGIFSFFGIFFFYLWKSSKNTPTQNE